MHCFQLISRASGEPAHLPTIDNEMCEHFNVEPHPTEYYRAWYDIIGLAFATGRTYCETRILIPEYSDILDYLEPRYTIRCWAQHHHN